MFDALRNGRTQTMKIHAGSHRFTPNPEVASSVHDSGIVLLHITSGHLYASNPTGARIWRGLEERLSQEAIADEIDDEYQIGRTTAQDHVQNFIAELQQQGLIQRETEL
jgi:hypothetical protein